MSAPPPRRHPVGQLLYVLAFLIGLAGLGVTVWLNVAQEQWREPVWHTDPQEAFVHASIGTELAPLVVFEALPALFPDEFAPIDTYLKAEGVTSPPAGDWVEQYGFVRKPPEDAGRADAGLPVGFIVSRHRPVSGAPSPVPFVGLACAACHSAEIRVEHDKPGRVLYGVGNPAMNLLAFSEAVRGMILKKENPEDAESDYVLTLGAVRRVHAAKGRALTPEETAMTWLWLRAARGEQVEYQRVIDEPLEPGRLFHPFYLRAGPARTQPFRSLVRVHLDRPGMSVDQHRVDQGFSKVPVVFHQAHEFHGEWAQFDGSVRNVVARSALAASTAGATVHSLAEPDIANNIRLAADYTLRLSPPTWAGVFGGRAPIDSAKAERGRAAYAENCKACHGEPDGAGGWRADPGSKFGTVIELKDIGTDPERVRFRHKSAVPAVVVKKFRDYPKPHPLSTFTTTDLRAPDGYYAGPIGGAFLRAPYLHNASVLTLAELIGLEKRRARFYRGRNLFDFKGVGLESPPAPEQGSKPRDHHYYFLFDTTVPGNANTGHEYPRFAFAGRPLSAGERAQLEDLLEYLKTL
ncbi:MAG TPA: hypothetical protein VKD90_03940 [Gemmataceae bacterium]|nr:hypothetical protein [Gemmataceae bacterium]